MLSVSGTRNEAWRPRDASRRTVLQLQVAPKKDLSSQAHFLAKNTKVSNREGRKSNSTPIVGLGLYIRTSIVVLGRTTRVDF